MVTQRQSNIEFCRIVSILLVMLVHTTKMSLGVEMSLGAFMLEGFTIIGVNVFILITGYFAATPKKKSLANLAFICLFWVIIKVLCCLWFDQPVTYRNLFFITSSNWFITSYIGLLFFAPILNLFCNTVDKKTIWRMVISLLFIEIWFDLLPPTPVVSLGTQRGYSVFAFIVLYLMARALRLYGLPEYFKKISPFVYLGCSLMLGFMAYVLKQHGFVRLNDLLFAYNNPIVILSSVAFLLMFEKMNIQSKVINYIAKSTLACLFGHVAIMFLYKKQFLFLYNNMTGIQMVGYWALSVLIVFCASIAIDQIRLLLYKPIEKLMKRKIKNNEIIPIENKS